MQSEGVVLVVPRLCSIPQAGRAAERVFGGGRAVMANEVASTAAVVTKSTLEIRPGSD
jgi:hypothetical protein